MSGYQADGVVEAIDTAMTALRLQMKAMPGRWQKFRSQHKDLTKTMSALSQAITDNRVNFTGSEAAGRRAASNATKRAAATAK